MDTAFAQTEMEKELKKLKKKCNFLIDKVQEQNRVILDLQHENGKLQKSAEFFQVEQKRNMDSQEAEPDELKFFVEQLEKVIVKGLERNAFFAFTYKTQNAREFVKIDCQDFEELIEKNTKMEVKKFMDYCKMLRVIGCTQNGRSAVWVDNTGTYMVSKKIIRYFEKKMKREAKA